MSDWLYSSPRALGKKRAFRLGLAANYGIDEDGVGAAMDRGVNVFFSTWRGKGLKNPLRNAVKTRREDVVVIGITTLGWTAGNIRRGAERLLRDLQTDYLDVFLMGWVGVAAAWTESTQRELVGLRESGKVRAIGMSIHDRPRAGKLAESSPLDLLMIRYNAAHPGAEQDIFPHLKEQQPNILAYTATAWRKLLKKPKGWTGPAMTAGDCYRFQLSSPHVDLALTGPKTRAEIEANLDALERGPLDADEAKWMREYGRRVHG